MCAFIETVSEDIAPITRAVTAASAVAVPTPGMPEVTCAASRADSAASWARMVSSNATFQWSSTFPPGVSKARMLSS